MLVLKLPWPPSVNHYWRSIIIKGSVRVLLSSDGRRYQADCAAAVWSEHGKLVPLAGRLEVVIGVYAPDRRRRDLDNMLKSVLDALKYVGAIKDDSQIDKLTISRVGCKLIEDGLLKVVVSQLPDDAPLLEGVV